jgi:hypothetical protein
MAVTLLATFDYELFLGEDSGSVDCCLIKPTELLLRCVECLGLQIVFFVDTTYLVELRKVACHSKSAADDYRKIRNQLIRISEAGHDVFPHLHPHWTNAQYIPESNRWSLRDFTHYSVAACSPSVRAEMMCESIKLLYELLERSPPSPLGYRAGGWCIQPFSVFEAMFASNGISIDFSVIPGRVSANQLAKYDFQSAPRKQSYRFKDDVCEENVDGEFWEIPISVIEQTSADQVIHDVLSRAFWRFGSGKTLGDGSAAVFMGEGQAENYKEKSKTEMASLDRFSIGKVRSYAKHALNNRFIHLCSHPKLLSPAGLSAFSLLVRLLRLRSTVLSNWKALCHDHAD